MIYPHSKCVQDHKKYGICVYLFSNEESDFYYYAEPQYNNNQWILRVYGDYFLDLKSYCFTKNAYYDEEKYKSYYDKSINLYKKYINLL